MRHNHRPTPDYVQVGKGMTRLYKIVLRYKKYVVKRNRMAHVSRRINRKRAR